MDDELLAKKLNSIERATAGHRSKAAQKRKQWLEMFDETGSRKKACATTDRTMETVRRWRHAHPEFQAAVDVIDEKWRKIRAGEVLDVHGSGGALPTDIPEQLTTGGYAPGSFEDFRSRELGTSTPEHQKRAADLWQTIRPGNILLMLWPPEHGKTTFGEDFFTWKFCYNHAYRVAIGSENRSLAARIILRVRNRMEPDGPYPNLSKKFGPLSPYDSRARGRTTNKVWGAKQWNLVDKPQTDERDYSALALGMGSAIAGSRTDHLHGDDVTSLRNYKSTKTPGGLIETFKQDWLTRPGEWGITTLNGTRVGLEDFYDVLMLDLPDSILTVVKQPAIRWSSEMNAFVPLWPERYNLEALERMRAKVGEEAWARNYMQEPLATSMSTFVDEQFEKVKDQTVSVTDHEIPLEHGFVCTLDPSIGNWNVWMITEVTSAWMMPVWIERHDNLVSYDQIFGQLDRLITRYTASGAPCLVVRIEDKAFQKGLMEDPALLALQNKWGFEIEANTTGGEKNDPDIGIPAMATTLRRKEIHFPDAPDETTQNMMELLFSELRSWRPYKRGNRLMQDQVMALYFAHRWWQQMRAHTRINVQTSEVRVAGLPYEPTGMNGLLLPSGFRG